MRHVVIGTAGHVDHGKTALIKAMTGVDADRLKEEKERQLSIDLGFSDIILPSGTHAAIVDVPGHERFIKNMLAGVTGIDLVLMVIAADEGIMPQTREHLDIVNLLGVERGVVALTKADLVDDEWLGLVRADVAEAIKGTVFENAPIVAVSSLTGQGIEELTKAIDSATADIAAPVLSGPFRVPIDRVFRMPGFGVVVTGTLTRGTIHVDDLAEILPNKGTARIRHIQVWGKELETANAAQRVGVNLSRLSKDVPERGDILVRPGSMRPTYLLDVRLTLTPTAPRPLRNQQRIRIHIGTAEVLGRVVLLDSETLEPGSEAFSQLRLEKMTAASQGDRFIIRRYSPPMTIGGGVVLDPNPRRHKRYQQPVLDYLSLLEQGSAAERLEHKISDRGPLGATIANLAQELQQDPAQTQKQVEALLQAGRIVALSGSDLLVHADALREFTNRVLTALRSFHAANPLQQAMPKREVGSAVSISGAEDALDALMRHLAGEGVIVAEAGGYRLPDHAVSLSPGHDALKKRMEAYCRDAGFAPPTQGELLAFAESPDAQTMLKMLMDEGKLVPVGEFIMHVDVITNAKAQIKQYLAEKGAMTVSQFRDLVGTTRKYAVPILEYLDRIGFTHRVGDERVLR